MREEDLRVVPLSYPSRGQFWQCWIGRARVRRHWRSRRCGHRHGWVCGDNGGRRCRWCCLKVPESENGGGSRKAAMSVYNESGPLTEWLDALATKGALLPMRPWAFPRHTCGAGGAGRTMAMPPDSGRRISPCRVRQFPDIVIEC